VDTGCSAVGSSCRRDSSALSQKRSFSRSTDCSGWIPNEPRPLPADIANRSELSSELWTPAITQVGSNGILRPSESHGSTTPASRQHRRRRKHSAAASTQILNRPVKVNVQSSEISRNSQDDIVKHLRRHQAERTGRVPMTGSYFRVVPHVDAQVQLKCYVPARSPFPLA
jgi:hypothetical protein